MEQNADLSKEDNGQPGDDRHPGTGPIVTITINNLPREIHRGRQTVAYIKTVGEVPLADDLEQVIHDRLVPLPDDGSVTIKDGEIFVSHPKDCGSS